MEALRKLPTTYRSGLTLLRKATRRSVYRWQQHAYARLRRS